MSGSSASSNISVRTSGSLLRVRLIVLAAAACGLVVMAPNVVSQAGSLESSIDVIRQILAKDGMYTRTTTSARNNYKSLTERKFSLSEAKGCKLVVESDSHVHSELPTQNRVSDRQSTDIFRPDFSQMDPSSVYIGDPPPPQASWETKGYLVRISVEGGRPPMVASTVEKATNGAHDLPGLPTLAVYVVSRESADRLAKAFAQVATACHSGAPAK